MKERNKETNKQMKNTQKRNVLPTLQYRLKEVVCQSIKWQANFSQNPFIPFLKTEFR